MDSFESIMYSGNRTLFQDKSDEELRNIVLTNSRLIMSLPANASGSMIADAKKWNSEVKAASDILKERQAERDNIEAATEVWKADANKRLLKNVINLPNAVSFHGQLIQAILEEAPASFEELANWCDELSVLDDDVVLNILNGLEKEGIIKKENDLYHLITVCTEDLYPEYPINWAMDKIRNSGKNIENIGKIKLVLQILYFEEVPMTSKTILEKMNKYRYFAEADDEITEADFEIDKYNISGIFYDLASLDIVESFMINYEPAYYIKQLGTNVSMDDADLEKLFNKIDAKILKNDNPTPTQSENVSYKKEILHTIKDAGKALTISEIMSMNAKISVLTNQRVSAIVRQMTDEDLLERKEIERKAYYALKG